MDDAELRRLLLEQDLERLNELEKLYAKGELWALPNSIALCAYNDLALPDWASKAFRHQWQRNMAGDLKSWDKAFGKPRTKKNLERSMRDLSAPREIWRMVCEAKRSSDPAKLKPVDDLLFEDMAKSSALERLKQRNAMPFGAKSLAIPNADFFVIKTGVTFRSSSNK